MCLTAAASESRERRGWLGLLEEAALSHTQESGVGSDGQPELLTSSRVFQRNSWGLRCPLATSLEEFQECREGQSCVSTSGSMSWALLFLSRGG